MAAAKKRHPVVGSERMPLPGARLAGAADPNERVLVTILLRRRSTSPGISAFVQDQAQRSAHDRQFLTHEEFAQVHGADPEDMEKVQAFAASQGLSVVEAHPAQRRLVLSGTVASVSNAFGVYLARYEHPAGGYRGRVGEVLVPDELAPMIEGVFGLDNRPQATPHFRVLDKRGGAVNANAPVRAPWLAAAPGSKLRGTRFRARVSGTKERATERAAAVRARWRRYGRDSWH